MPLYSLRASNSDEEKKFTYVQDKKRVQKFDPWVGLAGTNDFHFNVDCCSILLCIWQRTTKQVLGRLYGGDVRPSRTSRFRSQKPKGVHSRHSLGMEGGNFKGSNKVP